jgi:cysteine-rich repeat protein
MMLDGASTVALGSDGVSAMRSRVHAGWGQPVRQGVVGTLVSLCVLAAAAAEALDQPVAFRSLKLKQTSTKQSLTLSARDAAIPFPPSAGSGAPALEGALLEIFSPENLTGAAYLAPENSAGPDPGWTLKSGGATHLFKHRGAPDAVSSMKTVALKESGVLKIKGRSVAGALPMAAAPMFVRVTIGSLRICGTFETGDIVQFLPGARYVARNASDTATLTNCATVVFEGCGDGGLDAGEQCDDGNTSGGDGCRPDCTVEACGDGTVDPQEDCDDGNLTGGDDCPADCAICGSHHVAGAEDCDPPYTIGGLTSCDDGCRFAVCGDGAIEAGETCEPASGLDAACPGACGGLGADPCTCPGTCGNGIVDGSEPCDPEAPAATWTCPTDAFGNPALCSRPNQGPGCQCCDGGCGFFSLGCCTAGFCVPAPGGFGICAEFPPCIVDQGCPMPAVCEPATGFCCLPPGTPANVTPCSVLGVPSAFCCAPSTCESDTGQTFGGCCTANGLGCSGDPGLPFECCSGVCDAGGVCVCAPSGAACFTDSGCCSGNCLFGTCQP